MPASSSLTKERIKSRMVKNAARLWGAEDADVEVSFDPIVSMLIEGCVNEIGKINNDIADTQFRVINRMAELLTPDVITAPHPAHAILYAKPTEAETTITPELQFFFTRKIAAASATQQETSKEIFFSPLSNFNLIDGSVRYIAFADRIYQMQNGYQKSLVMEADSRRRLENNTFWIGLEMNSEIKDLDDLNFYFEVRNNPESQTFYNLLPHSKWFVEEFPLETDPGLKRNDHVAQLEDEFDLNERIRFDISALYDKCFVRIVSSGSNEISINKIRCKYPEKFSSVFRTSDLERISGQLVWLKVVFPAGINDALLSDVACNVNCFPIVNKKLNEFTFRLQSNLNIVPLPTSDYFLTVASVTTSDKFEYTSNPLANSRNYNAGTYTLRHGGIQRFDQRNAVETVSYLLDLLRDESAAFSVLGNDFLTSTIRQFNQLIALLEQRAGKQQLEGERTSYLIMNPRQAGENVFVSFWSANGELGNNIRAGNKLELYSGGDVRNDTLFLMTTTKGGKNRLNDMERLSAFKSSLIARGRIVTPNDVKLFCMAELGEQILEVEVKKGFSIGSDSLTGFVQTVDVMITPSQKLRSLPEHWESICADLREKLQQRSASFIPFRVMIEKQVGT
ncbi:MAG TPA: type VI secretion system baseplate subunit TssF [Chitinophagales bacterium]|nr:type VI secretion system baseplate subunit TssF [Chitinophagales bacterium]